MDNPFHSTIREDIRFLGKLLGDTLKEQEGPATYQLIEKIRQLSVAYRHRDDRKAGRELDRRLAQLSPEQTVSVIRAFSYFSPPIWPTLPRPRHGLRKKRTRHRVKSRRPSLAYETKACAAKNFERPWKDVASGLCLLRTPPKCNERV